MAPHADYGPQRPALNHVHLVAFIQIPMVLLENGIDVSGVALLGCVAESLQEVPANRCFGAARVGFGGSKRFPLISQIEKAGDASRFRIDLNLDVPIPQRLPRSLDSWHMVIDHVWRDAWLRRGTPRICPHKISSVAQGWRIRKHEETHSIGGRVQGQQLVFNPLARAIDYLNLSGGAGKLYLRLNHFGSRPGKRIENHDRHTVPSRICALGVDVSQ